MINLKLTYLLLGFLIVSVKSKAQTDYVFYSNEEEELFKKAQNKEPYDTFKLLYFVEGKSVDEFNALEKKLNEFYAKNKEILSQTSKTKTYKYLHKEIQKTFFTKFVDSAQLPHLYRKGEYNCLMGTSIYSYFLQKMKVPYQVMEAPGHVYVKTNINGKEINFETTIPKEQGTYVVSVEEKQKFVDQLLESKIISSEDLVKKGYEKCYRDYLYDTSFLSMKSLVGMAYFNSAAFAIQNANYKKAISQYEKCKLFYNSKMTDYNQNLAVAYLVEMESKKENNYKQTAKYILQYNTKLIGTFVEQNVHSNMYKLLMENSDFEGFKELYPYIQTVLSNDSSYTNNIRHSYFWILGTYYNAVHETDSAIKNMIIAYKLKRTNLALFNDIETLLIKTVMSSEEKLKNNVSSYGFDYNDMETLSPNSYRNNAQKDAVPDLVENAIKIKKQISITFSDIDSSMFEKLDMSLKFIHLIYTKVFPIVDSTNTETNPKLLAEKAYNIYKSIKFGLTQEQKKYYFSSLIGSLWFVHQYEDALVYCNFAQKEQPFDTYFVNMEKDLRRTLLYLKYDRKSEGPRPSVLYR